MCAMHMIHSMFLGVDTDVGMGTIRNSSNSLHHTTINDEALFCSANRVGYAFESS